MNPRILLVILIIYPLLWAAGLDARSSASFCKMMVAENGRIMPLDSFARIVLKRFSGRQSLSDRTASAWMSDLLLRPDVVGDEAVFLIDHPDIFHALGLQGSRRGRFSYRQLQPHLSRLAELAQSAFRMESPERTVVENGLLQLYENIYQYVTLRDSFIFFFPHGDFAVASAENRRALGLPESSGPHYSFFDILASKDRLTQVLADTEGESDAQRTELLNLSGKLQRWQESGDRRLFHIIPGEDENQPWRGINSVLDVTDPFFPAVAIWKQAIAAYRGGRLADFDRRMAEFNSLVSVHPVAAPLEKAMSRELFYNVLDSFFWARVAYGAALILLLFSNLFWVKGMRTGSLLLVLAGLLIHTMGLVLRYLITHRSPVTNLYETFVFVAWAAVLLGLSLGLRRHLPLCLTASGASGLAFLMIAARFGSGDTMGQLVAVLNSNWWLSVHVITITAGYAGCVVAGVIAHVHIVQSLMKAPSRESLNHSQRTLYGTLVFGLFFTFVGTVMGGIWADQSWGRFWGWDPKENGALVIIIWVAIILHARLARLVGPFGFAAGAIGSIVMVVLAWFGVNLLGVGMHSYGFTSGIARGLILFVICEILFVVLAGLRYRQRS